MMARCKHIVCQTWRSHLRCHLGGCRSSVLSIERNRRFLLGARRVSYIISALYWIVGDGGQTF